MDGLRLRANKDNLEQWLEDLKSIDLSQYTEESAAVVRAVIARAEALAAQDLSSFEQNLIDEMVAEMANAKAQLVPAAGTEDPKNPGQNGSSQGGSSADGKAPTTGDSTPIAALSVMALATVGALFMLKKRKSR